MTQTETGIAHAGSGPKRAPKTFEPIGIEEGFTINDVKTIDDCERATALLLMARRSIENQIAEFAEGDYGPNGDRDARWLRRARGALTVKGIALQQVQTRRAALGREERRLAAEANERSIFSIVREIAPEVANQAIEIARTRGLAA